MPTEMELRVAAAIDPDAFASEEPEYGRPHQAARARKAISRARAAIRAMREPTDAMIVQGDKHQDGWQDGATLANAWAAMIDAATSVEPEPR